MKNKQRAKVAAKEPTKKDKRQQKMSKKELDSTVGGGFRWS